MAEKRAEIIAAARPIFLRDGLGGITLDRVASEGGISKMTLYRHFPSKEALFEALVVAMCDEMRVHAEGPLQARAGLSAAERLTEEARDFTTALTRPEALGFYRLIVAEGWRFPELAQTFERSGMAVLRQRIGAILAAAGIPAGEVERRASQMVHLALGDAYQRAVLGLARTDDALTFEAQIRAAVCQALDRRRTDIEPPALA